MDAYICHTYVRTPVPLCVSYANTITNTITLANHENASHTHTQVHACIHTWINEHGRLIFVLNAAVLSSSTNVWKLKSHERPQKNDRSLFVTSWMFLQYQHKKIINSIPPISKIAAQTKKQSSITIINKFHNFSATMAQKRASIKSSPFLIAAVDGAWMIRWLTDTSWQDLYPCRVSAGFEASTTGASLSRTASCIWSMVCKEQNIREKKFDLWEIFMMETDSGKIVNCKRKWKHFRLPSFRHQSLRNWNQPWSQVWNKMLLVFWMKNSILARKFSIEENEIFVSNKVLFTN